MDHTIARIAARLLHWKDQGKRVFATTSLQTQSLPLLHLLHRIDPTIRSYYVDTGYLFPETITFRDRLIDRFGFNIHPVTSTATTDEQWGPDGRPLYESDPDACCAKNKVQPMIPLLQRHEIWVNGVRAEQSKARSAMAETMDAGHGCLRYHPLLYWTRDAVAAYRARYDLLQHPLTAQGYRSIGCWPCSQPVTAGMDERDGRWAGKAKTECGLHTALVLPSGNILPVNAG